MLDLFERQNVVEDREFERAAAKEARDRAKAGNTEPVSTEPQLDRVFTPEDDARLWAKEEAALDANIDAVRAKVRRPPRARTTP